MKVLLINMWVSLMEGIGNPTFKYAPVRVYTCDSLRARY